MNIDFTRLMNLVNSRLQAAAWISLIYAVFLLLADKL